MFGMGSFAVQGDQSRRWFWLLVEGMKEIVIMYIQLYLVA
jgi:hypothetical protein